MSSGQEWRARAMAKAMTHCEDDSSRENESESPDQQHELTVLR